MHGVKLIFNREMEKHEKTLRFLHVCGSYFEVLNGFLINYLCQQFAKCLFISYLYMFIYEWS